MKKSRFYPRAWNRKDKMPSNVLLDKTGASLAWFILVLSVAALTIEIAPEMEAKIIVVSLLVSMITLFIVELKEHWHFKWKWLNAFKIMVIGFIGISLAGEILVDEGAKIIVIPTLALAILTSLIEVGLIKTNNRV
jgi:hypothetical protein